MDGWEGRKRGREEEREGGSNKKDQMRKLSRCPLRVRCVCAGGRARGRDGGRARARPCPCRQRVGSTYIQREGRPNREKSSKVTDVWQPAAAPGEKPRARFEEGWAAVGGRGAPRSLPLSGYFWFSPRARSPSVRPSSSQLHTCSRGCNWIGWCCVVRMLPLAVPANGKRRKVVQRYDVRIWRGTWGPREAETQSDVFF